jgi:hypothetical protein
MHHTFDFTRLVPGRDLSRLSTFVQMAQIARARPGDLALLLLCLPGGKSK